MVVIGDRGRYVSVEFEIILKTRWLPRGRIGKYAFIFKSSLDDFMIVVFGDIPP